MRFEDVWIAGTGGIVGERKPIEAAVAAGHYDSMSAESTRIESYSETTLAPPEMAVIAGNEAIKLAYEFGVTVGPDTALIHAHSSFQGVDMWPVECWIAGQLIGQQLSGMPTTVGAASNGSLAGLATAATLLSAHPSIPNAIVTVADRFPAPLDRFRLSPGMVFGDGGAAAVLVHGDAAAAPCHPRGAGRLRVRTVVSCTDTALEGLARGNEPFRTRPELMVDTARRTREFLARGELSLRDIRDRSVEGVSRAVRGALSEAELSLADIGWYIPPFVGERLRLDSFVKPLGHPAPGRDLAALGRTLGHLGPADHLYALDHLIKHDLLAPSERILLVGTGMGFTFSAAVIEAAPPASSEGA